MSIKKLSNFDKEEIISKIYNTLDSHLRKAYDWIHTDEGQIVVNVIGSLSSYVVGDPTGVLMPSIIQSSDIVARKRFLKHYPDLLKRLDDEKDRLNESFLKSEVGQQLLRDILRELINQTNDEKIEYLKQFLLNSYIMADMKNQEIEEYLEILKSLQPTQLQILNILINPEDIAEKISQKQRQQLHPTYALREDLRDILQLDNEIFERSIKKLESFGLISTTKRALDIQWATGYYTGENVATKNQMIKGYQSLVTDFGRKFIRFISKNS